MASSLESLLHHPALGLRTADQLSVVPSPRKSVPRVEDHGEEALARLLRGGIHEWFYQPDEQAIATRGGRHWHCPITLVTALVSIIRPGLVLKLRQCTTGLLHVIPLPQIHGLKIGILFDVINIQCHLISAKTTAAIP